MKHISELDPAAFVRAGLLEGAEGEAK